MACTRSGFASRLQQDKSLNVSKEIQEEFIRVKEEQEKEREIESEIHREREIHRK